MHHEFLGSEGFQGTHIDALNQFSSKFVNLFGKFSPLCGGPEMQTLAKKVRNFAPRLFFYTQMWRKSFLYPYHGRNILF